MADGLLPAFSLLQGGCGLTGEIWSVLQYIPYEVPTVPFFFFLGF
jgi:hypothetical protein